MKLWVKIARIQIEDDTICEYFDSIFGICFNVQIAHNMLAIMFDLHFTNVKVMHKLWQNIWN